MRGGRAGKWASMEKCGTVMINSLSHDTFVVYLVVCAFYSNHKLVNFNLRIFAERGEMGVSADDYYCVSQNTLLRP